MTISVENIKAYIQSHPEHPEYKDYSTERMLSIMRADAEYVKLSEQQNFSLFYNPQGPRNTENPWQVSFGHIPGTLDIKPGKYPINAEPHEIEAYSFLSSIFNQSSAAFNQQIKTEGWISNAVNAARTVANSESSRKKVEKTLNETKSDLKFLDAALRGSLVVVGEDDTPLSFEEAFKRTRGVSYSKEKVQKCQSAAMQYMRADMVDSGIKSVLGTLLKNSTATTSEAVRVKNFDNAVLKAFKQMGVTNAGDINKFLAQVCEKNANNPIIKEYGGDFKLSKNSDGSYSIVRRTKTGYAALTPEQARLVTDEFVSTFTSIRAQLLGLDKNATAEECDIETAHLKKDYLAKFKDAYGTKELNALAEQYIRAQQEGVGYVQMGVSLGSMALSMFTGGLTSAVSMGVAVTQPTVLIERATDADGLTKDELLDYGKMMLEQVPWMAVGMGAGKLGNMARSFVKLKGIQGMAAKSGQTLEDFMKVLQTAGKLDEGLVKASKITKVLAEGAGVTTETATNVGVILMVRGEDTTAADWVMSFVGAMAGTKINSKLAKMGSKDAQVKFLMDTFKDFNLTEMEAKNILKAMEEQRQINTSSGLPEGPSHVHSQVRNEAHENNTMVKVSLAENDADGFIIRIGDEEIFAKDLKTAEEILSSKVPKGVKIDCSDLGFGGDIIAGGGVPKSISENYSRTSIQNLSSYLAKKTENPEIYMEAVGKITEQIKSGKVPSKAMLDEAAMEIKNQIGGDRKEISNIILMSMSKVDELKDFVNSGYFSSNAVSETSPAFRRKFAQFKEKIDQSQNDSGAKIDLDQPAETKPAKTQVQQEPEVKTKQEIEIRAREEAEAQRVKEQQRIIEQQRADYAKYTEKYPELSELPFRDDNSLSAVGKMMEEYEVFLKDNEINYSNFDSSEIYGRLSSLTKDADVDIAFDFIKRKYHQDVIAEETRISNIQHKYLIDETQIKQSESIIDQLRQKHENGEPVTMDDIDTMIRETFGFNETINGRVKRFVVEDPTVSTFIDDTFNVFNLTARKAKRMANAVEEQDSNLGAAKTEVTTPTTETPIAVVSSDVENNILNFKNKLREQKYIFSEDFQTQRFTEEEIEELAQLYRKRPNLTERLLNKKSGDSQLYEYSFEAIKVIVDNYSIKGNIIDFVLQHQDKFPDIVTVMNKLSSKSPDEAMDIVVRMSNVIEKTTNEIKGRFPNANCSNIKINLWKEDCFDLINLKDKHGKCFNFDPTILSGDPSRVSLLLKTIKSGALDNVINKLNGEISIQSKDYDKFMLYTIDNDNLMARKCNIRIADTGIEAGNIIESFYVGDKFHNVVYTDVGKIVDSQASKQNMTTYRKNVYSNDGTLIRRESISQNKDRVGEFDITVKERTADGTYTTYNAGGVKMYGTEEQGFRSRRRVKSTSGDVTRQVKRERPNQRGTKYVIIDKDGNVLFRNKRQQYKIDENHFMSKFNDHTYQMEFEPDGISVTKINDKTGVRESVKLDYEQLDRELVELYKKLPGDYLFRLKEHGIHVKKGYEENNACFSLKDNTIYISEELINDPFTFAHEFGHALDHLKFSNAIRNDEQFLALYKEELEIFRKNSGKEEMDIIDYFTEFYSATSEVIAETNALISGLEDVTGHLGVRSVILQQNFPKTIAYLAKLLESE